MCEEQVVRFETEHREHRDTQHKLIDAKATIKEQKLKIAALDKIIGEKVR